MIICWYYVDYSWNKLWISWPSVALVGFELGSNGINQYSIYIQSNFNQLDINWEKIGRRSSRWGWLDDDSELNKFDINLTRFWLGWLQPFESILWSSCGKRWTQRGCVMDSAMACMMPLATNLEVPMPHMH